MFVILSGCLRIRTMGSKFQPFTLLIGIEILCLSVRVAPEVLPVDNNVADENNPNCMSSSKRDCIGFDFAIFGDMMALNNSVQDLYFKYINGTVPSDGEVLDVAGLTDNICRNYQTIRECYSLYRDNCPDSRLISADYEGGMAVYYFGALRRWNYTCDRAHQLVQQASSTTGQPAVTPPNSNTKYDPLITTCSRNRIVLPSIAVEETEAAVIRFTGDDSRKCTVLACCLHSWLIKHVRSLDRELSTTTNPVGTHSEETNVVVKCTGNAVFHISALDPDTVLSNNVTVHASYTKQCREFFYRVQDRINNSYFYKC